MSTLMSDCRCPQWSLTFVLNQLMKPPFEPMAMLDLRLLIYKTVFLGVVTSARRASEVRTLRRDSAFLEPNKDKVTLCTDMSFLIKAFSDLHLNQPLMLPTVFLASAFDLERSQCECDVCRTLAFYTFRKKGIQKSSKSFINYEGPKKGEPITPQCLSKWIVNTEASYTTEIPRNMQQCY